ncbi:cilia- and flagella-associated protein 91 [Drosophila subobscura]|uniref:cilia- and flagella-associated protein 91 n=1 Tax=Drosophila subobscura TaxID=7241 RepID=UPI00155B121E|nr:cilia- and flagella-associated protein 91 [Drosophila subobscura]
MNYLIQAGKVRQQAITCPEGLPEILADITREVLRCQPTKECLCQFIIDYLHSVIVTREKALVARSILDRSLRQVETIISDLCVCDLTKEKSDMMGQVLEDCFRNFLERRRCEMRRGKETINLEDIDIFEELLEKCKFSEEELAISRPAVESAYKRFVDAYMAAARGTDGTELLYQYFRDRELKRIREAMREQSATIIQAAWRGYLVRANLPEHICTCTCMVGDEAANVEDLRREHAARVIQRFFRKCLTRVALKPIVDPCGEVTEASEPDSLTPPETTTKAEPQTYKSAPTPPPTAADTVAVTAQQSDATVLAAVSPEEEAPAAVSEAEAPESLADVAVPEEPSEAAVEEAPAAAEEEAPPAPEEALSGAAEEPPAEEASAAPEEPPPPEDEAPAAAEEDAEPPPPEEASAEAPAEE